MIIWSHPVFISCSASALSLTLGAKVPPVKNIFSVVRFLMHFMQNVADHIVSVWALEPIIFRA